MSNGRAASVKYSLGLAATSLTSGNGSFFLWGLIKRVMVHGPCGMDCGNAACILATLSLKAPVDGGAAVSLHRL